MSEMRTTLLERDIAQQEINLVIAELESMLSSSSYTVVEKNTTKPWGAYMRMDGADADAFVEDFFPGLDPVEARLGNPEAELSPKVLVVAPDQRLSWQYHDRRAERWCFLTPGAYRKSIDDQESEIIHAQAGEVVQFAQGERHRLEGLPDQIVVVAEIWQHSDPDHPSDEDDITRLQDDYQR